MKIDRAALVQHLEKISCGGQVPGAVFRDAFAAAALTEDQLLCVVAPSLDKVEPLPEPVGLPDLSLLIKSLGVLSGAGNEGTAVHVDVEEHRLVLDEEYRGTLRLLTANPKTVGTNVKEATVKRLLDKAPSGDGIPLTRSLIDGIQKTFNLLKAKELEIHVGPDGGKIVVGNENSHLAEFPAEQIRGEEEYTLLFDDHLVDVLGVITNFSEAKLVLGGPDTLIAVEDGPYKYLLSPRKRGADAS